MYFDVNISLFSLYAYISAYSNVAFCSQHIFKTASSQVSYVFHLCIKTSNYLYFLIYFYLLSAFALLTILIVLKHIFFWLLWMWLFSLCLTRGQNLMCDSLSKSCTRAWTSVRIEGRRDFSIYPFIKDTFRVLNFTTQQYTYLFGSSFCFLCGFIILYLAFKY